MTNRKQEDGNTSILNEQNLSSVRSALAGFKESNPWSGTFGERVDKFVKFHRAMNRINHRHVGLFVNMSTSLKRWSESGQSLYHPPAEIIMLSGRLSVVTFLHEWAHALGMKDETTAQKWAMALFKDVFPDKAQVLKDAQKDGRFMVREEKE